MPNVRAEAAAEMRKTMLEAPFDLGDNPDDEEQSFPEFDSDSIEPQGEYALYANNELVDYSDDLGTLKDMAIEYDEWHISHADSGEEIAASDVVEPEPEPELEPEPEEEDEYDYEETISDDDAMRIARNIEMNFGNTFPDGDPTDGAMRELEKAGYPHTHSMFYDVADKVQDAFSKQTGSDGYYGYYDDLLSQVQADNPGEFSDYSKLNDDVQDIRNLAGMRESEISREAKKAIRTHTKAEPVNEGHYSFVRD